MDFHSRFEKTPDETYGNLITQLLLLFIALLRCKNAVLGKLGRRRLYIYRGC